MQIQISLSDIAQNYNRAFTENRRIVKDALKIREQKQEPVTPTIRPPKSPFPLQDR